MAYLLGRIAGAAAGHWKRSLAILAAAIVGIAVLASVAGGEFSDDFMTPGTESQQAFDLLSTRFPTQLGDTATLVFSVQRGTLRDGRRAAAIRRTIAQVARQPHVTAAGDPLAGRGGQVSRDGRIAFATVQYDKPIRFERVESPTREQACPHFCSWRGRRPCWGGQPRSGASASRSPGATR